MIDTDYLALMYFQNDYPCPYKLRCGYEINIYPVKVKDYSIYEYSSEILQINKEALNNMEIIQMSYLEFLSKVALKDQTNVFKLFNIFKYCLHEENVTLGYDNGKICAILTDENNTIRAKISAKEFDEIKLIILNQNNPNYDGRYISPEVQYEIQQYYNLKYKNTHNPTLEQKKAYTISKTGFTMNEVNEMTYRLFIQVYQSCVDTDIYFGRKIIQGSYKYDVKEEVQYPLYEPKKDILDEIFNTTSEQMANKINQVNG